MIISLKHLSKWFYSRTRCLLFTRYQYCLIQKCKLYRKKQSQLAHPVCPENDRIAIDIQRDKIAQKEPSSRFKVWKVENTQTTYPFVAIFYSGPLTEKNVSYFNSNVEKAKYLQCPIQQATTNSRIPLLRCMSMFRRKETYRTSYPSERREWIE